MTSTSEVAAPVATRQLDVALLRDVPEQKSRSMERFADALEAAFASRPGVAVRPKTMHESRWAARLGLGLADSYLLRFVRYPLSASHEEADVYHVVDQGYGHLAARLPHARTVITCHDLMLLLAEDGLAGFRGRRVSVRRFRWSVSYLRSVGHVACPSEATRQDVIRMLGVDPDRVSVVPNGVDKRFRPLPAADRAALRADLPGSHQALLMHVSTGIPYKNENMTIEVLARLRERGIDAALIRIGRTLSSAQQRLASERGVLDQILDLGAVSDERLVELYNVADLVLFPSFYEGFGWPPLEGMACGTPAVTSNCPALLEVVGDPALTASPYDAGRLTDAAEQVLTCAELRAELSERGLERAAMFTWDRAAERLESIYRRLADEAPARSER